MQPTSFKCRLERTGSIWTDTNEGCDCYHWWHLPQQISHSNLSWWQTPVRPPFLCFFFGGGGKLLSPSEPKVFLPILPSLHQFLAIWCLLPQLCLEHWNEMPHTHTHGWPLSLSGTVWGFKLPFIRLPTRMTCISVASTVSKQMAPTEKDLYLGFSSTCHVFMHNFLSLLDYAGIRLWILMVGIYNLVLCLFCWLIQGHFIS